MESISIYQRTQQRHKLPRFNDFPWLKNTYSMGTFNKNAPRRFLFCLATIKKQNVTHIDSHVTAWGDRCLCGLGVKIYQTSGFCRCIGGTWKCPSDAKKKNLWLVGGWVSTHLKNMQPLQIGSWNPKVRGKNKKHLKPPPSYDIPLNPGCLYCLRTGALNYGFMNKIPMTG